MARGDLAARGVDHDQLVDVGHVKLPSWSARPLGRSGRSPTPSPGPRPARTAWRCSRCRRRHWLRRSRSRHRSRPRPRRRRRTRTVQSRWPARPARVRRRARPPPASKPPARMLEVSKVRCCMLTSLGVWTTTRSRAGQENPVCFARQLPGEERSRVEVGSSTFSRRARAASSCGRRKPRPAPDATRTCAGSGAYVLPDDACRQAMPLIHALRQRQGQGARESTSWLLIRPATRKR